MKQGSFRAVRLIVFLLAILGMAAYSAFGDEVTVDFASITLDDFDGDTNHQWSFGGKTFSYDFDWALDASRFSTPEREDAAGNVTGPFPQINRISAWPMALYGINREGNDLRSLGIMGKFDRQGYNWVDVYPVIPGSGDGEPEPFEIPIPGRIQYLDMWVWGSNLNYYIEAYFRDSQGVVHTLNMGSLAFQGWKNMRVQIPTSIRQSRRVLPRYAGLEFVKFRIWTTPAERVDQFYVYFDQMKILTDTFESLFDGDDLADVDRVQELWSQNQPQAQN